jgi:transcriptional regulator with XRE-family HTH domain
MVIASTLRIRAAGRVRAAVEAAGFTREALADRLGVTYDTLSRKLIGRRSISPEELIEISTALSIRPSALLADAEPDKRAVS